MHRQQHARNLLWCKIIPLPLESQVPDAEQHVADADKDRKVQIAEGRYIVVFEDQAEGWITQHAAKTAKQTIVSVFLDLSISRDSLIHEYLHVSKGFSAYLSDEQVKALEREYMLCCYMGLWACLKEVKSYFEDRRKRTFSIQKTSHISSASCQVLHENSKIRIL